MVSAMLVPRLVPTQLRRARFQPRLKPSVRRPKEKGTILLAEACRNSDAWKHPAIIFDP